MTDYEDFEKCNSIRIFLDKDEKYRQRYSLFLKWCKYCENNGVSQNDFNTFNDNRQVLFDNVKYDENELSYKSYMDFTKWYMSYLDFKKDMQEL